MKITTDSFDKVTKIIIIEASEDKIIRIQKDNQRIRIVIIGIMIIILIVTTLLIIWDKDHAIDGIKIIPFGLLALILINMRETYVLNIMKISIRCDVIKEIKSNHDKIAQQGDAPEPATNADSASLQFIPPAR